MKILVLLFTSIYFFQYQSTWIAPIVLLITMKLIHFTKEQFLFSFGSMMLYGILGIIPILIPLVVNFNTVEPQIVAYQLLLNSSVYIVFFGFIIQGMLFGKILQYLFYWNTKKCSKKI